MIYFVVEVSRGDDALAKELSESATNQDRAPSRRVTDLPRILLRQWDRRNLSSFS